MNEKPNIQKEKALALVRILQEKTADRRNAAGVEAAYVRNVHVLNDADYLKALAEEKKYAYGSEASVNSRVRNRDWGRVASLPEDIAKGEERVSPDTIFVAKGATSNKTIRKAAHDRLSAWSTDCDRSDAQDAERYRDSQELQASYEKNTEPLVQTVQELRECDYWESGRIALLIQKLEDHIIALKEWDINTEE